MAFKLYIGSIIFKNFILNHLSVLDAKLKVGIELLVRCVMFNQTEINIPVIKHSLTSRFNIHTDSFITQGQGSLILQRTEYKY